MIISTLPNSSSNSNPIGPVANNVEFINPSSKEDGFLQDRVELSASAHQLMEKYLSKQTLQTTAVIPSDQRPTAKQTAETILGFISNEIERRANEGASSKELSNTLYEALNGFHKGVSEAFNIIEGLSVKSENVHNSIMDTKALVYEGLDELRETYVNSGTVDDTLAKAISDAPTIPSPSSSETPASSTVIASTSYSSQVVSSSTVSSSSIGSSKLSSPEKADVFTQASPTNNTIRSASAIYAESYRQNESVDLEVKTRDGDIVTLSFTSQFSANRGIAAFLSNSGQSASAAQAYQSNVNTSASFNFTVQGSLDNDEVDALNNLLKQVTELTDEFLNGDFDQALSLANEFQLDTKEFSSLSLDLARSTRESIVEGLGYAENTANQATQALQGSDVIASVLEQLKDAMESARSFSEPKSLLSDLLANQLAQRSVVSPGFNNESVTRLLDELIG